MPRHEQRNPYEEVIMIERLALCVLVAVGGVSQTSVSRPLHNGPEFFQLWQEELQLSDEQLDRINELHFETRLEEIEKRSLVERAELELAREMDATDPSEERVMDLFEDAHEARMELERIHLRNRLRMKSILSETQERALRRLLAEHRAARAQRKGPPPQHTLR
jgi:Spy/CpxP family protein refolding chaperone